MTYARKPETVAKGAGRIRRIKPKTVGAGVEVRPGYPRIVIEFDNEMFAEIRKRAIACGVSFSEQARTLIQWGLDEDSDFSLTNDLRKDLS